MKDYAAMSDQQINRLVAAAASMEYGAHYMGDIVVLRDNRWVVFDPCNNPADAWPIITQYRISIIDLNDKEWGCRVESAHGVMRAINENPLRCAMVVFLMMKDGE